ncbi:CobD/CbiB family cobalamin biosynthesis protein [Ruminococcus sp. Marseille-P6503]|uniref:cobalamin biosynthesis protein CobD/CbiB n=1 Tax=Ruminococcus sp. Marseille-P6503 TaxID=2364796 RepID=UPI000F529B01|nr:CobD/CbiB family cobalamin biosynthesis protein [Ruminococcus sp. Marseille-P6503]
MILNTVAAMSAGFVLNLMFGAPRGFLNPENFVPAFALKLEKTLRRFYEDSPEALRMAGAVLIFFVLLIFAGIPLALLILGYMFLPVAGLILDCFFCWLAFSFRDTRIFLSRTFRAVRSGNYSAAAKSLEALTGTDCSGLDEDEIIKKAVECAADCSADNGAGALFFMALAGGFGGMLYRCVSILNRTIGTDTPEYADFGSPSRTLWTALDFIPASICGLVMKLDVSFLRLDKLNCKRIFRRDRKNLSRANLGICRSVVAGALDIQLTKEEYYRGGGLRARFIGEQLKPCQPNDIYWANQLMYGSVFGCFLLFALIRTAFLFIL